MKTAIELTPADADRMAVLHQRAFPRGEAWAANAFKDLLNQPSVRGQALEQGSDLFAFILVQYVAGQAEILTLATDPSYRRRGAARYLLTGMEQQLGLERLEKWLLDVAADNAGAIAFYEKLGFQRDGRRSGYYKRLEGPAMDAILMSKPVGGQGAT